MSLLERGCLELSLENVMVLGLVMIDSLMWFWSCRLLKALGASHRTRIYWAGGEPFGKQLALEPLMAEFPHLYSKDNLATPEELEPFKKKASILAAIDYLVCLNSDVFFQSHGGNFGRVMQVRKSHQGNLSLENFV